MNRQPDTGESATTINRRGDDAAWPKIEALLLSRHTLHRAAKTQRYFPHNGRDYVGGTGGISASRVKRLEREGVIKHVGVDRYALAQSEAAHA